jgi:dihydropteroate synthase
MTKKVATDIVHRFTLGKRVYDFSSRTHIMGILNVTPDSFSDGGRYFDRNAAIDHGLRMVEEGADIIDIGGESTRPRGNTYGMGAENVTAAEELRRVLPVIEALADRTDVPLSIDTYKSEVAREALSAGAVLVNDISGFRFDPFMPAVVAAAKASAVLMHIQGTPQTMQMNPSYENVVAEVREYLAASVQKGRDAGITQLLVDPGLGFGKSLDHNLQLIGQLASFRDLGCPVLVGPSRKSFLGKILDLPVEERREGTLAAIVASILYGAHVVRVHDIREAVRAARVADAIHQTVIDPA